MSDTFDHEADAWDDALFGRTADGSGEGGLFPRRSRGNVQEGNAHPRCSTCHDYNVRWRQQAGRWVLFSLQPGVVHTCALKPFDAIPDPDA